MAKVYYAALKDYEVDEKSGGTTSGVCKVIRLSEHDQELEALRVELANIGAYLISTGAAKEENASDPEYQIVRSIKKLVPWEMILEVMGRSGLNDSELEEALSSGDGAHG